MSFASLQHVKHKGSPSSIVPVTSRTGSPKSSSEVNKVRGEFNYRLEDNKMVEHRDVLETMLPKEQWKKYKRQILVPSRTRPDDDDGVSTGSGPRSPSGQPAWGGGCDRVSAPTRRSRSP